MINNIRSGIRGLGPLSLQSGGWRRCYHKELEGCEPTGSVDPDEVDTALSCCKRGVCTLCLEWEDEGSGSDDPTTGSATGSGTMTDPYLGDINGYEFKAYWTKDPECKLVVYMDDILVAEFPKCGDAAASCSDPTGEFEFVVDEGSGSGSTSTTAIVSFETLKPLAVSRTPGTPPGECYADVAVIVDLEYRHPSAVQDIQDDALQPLVDALDSQFDNYRIALLWHHDTSSGLTEDFALNNGAAFLAAVDTLTSVAVNTGFVERSRRSDTALATAEGLSWRNAARKFCVLLSGGIPGEKVAGVDPEPGNEFDLDQRATASAFFNKGIKLHTISLPVLLGETQTYNAYCQDVNAATASLANGTHQSVLMNGDDDNNGGTNELAAAINGLVETIECSDSRCARLYCGNCECADEVLCLTYYTCDCFQLAKLESESPVCERTGEVSSLAWNGILKCPFEEMEVAVTVSRDDYTGGCLVQVDFGEVHIEKVLEGCKGVNFFAEIPEEMGGGWLAIATPDQCGPICRFEACWTGEPRCLDHGTKANCCDEQRPVYWSASPGWFDPECSILTSTCPLPEITDGLTGDPCGGSASGEGGAGSGIDCTHTGNSNDGPWTLYLSGVDTYMEHDETGLRYVTHDSIGWTEICQNVLFREDLCLPLEDQVCVGDCAADYVCLSPFNVCVCDELEGEGGRPAMPGSIPYTANSGDCCGSTSGSVGWNPELGGWHGVLKLPDCSGDVEMLLVCRGGLGQDYELQFYNGTLGHGVLSDVTLNPLDGDGDRSCYPFLRKFISGVLDCPAEFVQGVHLTFLEELT